MSDQETEALIFCNQNLPAGTADRPLVTFALFAYNQQEYIREALDGALSQSYQPLEIILSDDCSTDRTFDIMREVVAAYTGPHRVILRRSEINLGTALHVSAVAKMASGELIVVAAGDDISMPLRTETLVGAWIESGKQVATVHSKLLEFFDANQSMKRQRALRVNKETTIDLEWFIKRKALPFLSPTCAYSKEIFNKFPPLIGGSIIEDEPLAFRTFLVGRFLAVDEYLVRQRKSDRTAGTGYKITEPGRWNVFIHSKIVSCATMLRDLSHCPEVDFANRQALEAYFLKVIRQFSGCLLELSRQYGILSRFILFVRLVWFYPNSVGFLHRVYFALSFLELDKSQLVEFLRKTVSRFRS